MLGRVTFALDTPDEQAGLAVVRRLRERGFVAYFAGGCVRDRLLGCPPKDVDVATSATPDEVRASFKRTLEVGAAFGVVRVREQGLEVEVATFRVDGSYADGRRPESVRFSTPEEDARRRDFTINGMFLDPVTGEVIDFVGGREDLGRRVVRAIGDPEARFAEDRLRLLRAPRFAARMGFTVEAGTAAAARLHAPELVTSAVSQERIHGELDRILTHPSRARGLTLVAELGLLPHSLPEVSDVPRVVAALAALPPRVAPALAWAVALHLAGADRAFAAMERLKASNEARTGVQAIVEGASSARALAGWSTPERIRFLRRKDLEQVLAALRAILSAGGEPPAAADALEAAWRAARDDQGPTGLAARPFVAGADLKAAGVPPGPAYARVIRAVEDAQLEGRVGDKAAALALALELVRQG
jgi:poly(A) polymerase